MKLVSFTVSGKPQGKARPRFSPHGVYTPQTTKAYEEKIANAYREVAEDVFFSGPVCLMVIAVFPIPKSWTIEKKGHAMAGEIIPGKPDIDNILKVVLDGLNGVAYDDDATVCQTVCQKVYAAHRDDEGHLNVWITTEKDLIPKQILEDERCLSRQRSTTLKILPLRNETKS